MIKLLFIYILCGMRTISQEYCLSVYLSIYHLLSYHEFIKMNLKYLIWQERVTDDRNSITASKHTLSQANLLLYHLQLVSVFQ